MAEMGIYYQGSNRARATTPITAERNKIADWNTVAVNSFKDFLDDLHSDHDPEERLSDAQDALNVVSFLLEVSPSTTEVLEQPSFMSGPNGEIFLNWEAPEKGHRFDIVFSCNKVDGLLSRAAMTAKVSSIDGCLSLIEQFSR